MFLNPHTSARSNCGTSRPSSPGRPADHPQRSHRPLAFSLDSTTLHAAGTHVPLQRYTNDPTQAVTRICARTSGADLTPAQLHTSCPTRRTARSAAADFRGRHSS